MYNEYQSTGKFPEATWRGLVGAALIVSGGLALIDQMLRLGWLAPLSVLAGGCVLLYGGYRFQAIGFIIAGWIVIGFGLGLALSLDLKGSWTTIQRIGFIFLFTGAGFAMITASFHRLFSKFVWWPLFPLGALGSIGYALVATQLRIVDFALSLGVGIGLAFLIVGLVKKMDWHDHPGLPFNRYGCWCVCPMGNAVCFHSSVKNRDNAGSVWNWLGIDHSF